MPGCVSRCIGKHGLHVTRHEQTNGLAWWYTRLRRQARKTVKKDEDYVESTSGEKGQRRDTSSAIHTGSVFNESRCRIRPSVVFMQSDAVIRMCERGMPQNGNHQRDLRFVVQWSKMTLQPNHLRHQLGDTANATSKQCNKARMSDRANGIRRSVATTTSWLTQQVELNHSNRVLSNEL